MHKEQVFLRGKDTKPDYYKTSNAIAAGGMTLALM